MNCDSIIPVYELLGENVISRTSSQPLMQIIRDTPCDYVELDFAGVRFISRSFADQFHCDKMQLCLESGKQIIVVNANDEIVSMLQVVSKTITAGERWMKTVLVYKYTHYWDLEEYLLSI